MAIYYIVYFSIIIYCVGVEHTRSEEYKKKRNMFIFAVVVLVSMFALRAQNMGNDLIGYLPAFDYFADLSWSRILSLPYYQNYDRGYILFNKLISLISKDRQFFLGACAFVSIFPVLFSAYKSKTNMLYATLIFMGIPVFPLLFSGLRQGIAVGLCSMALIFVRKRKIIPFIVFVVLATLFHFSAIIFIIAYPLYRWKVNRSIRYLSIATLPFFYLFRYKLFNTFTSLFRENAVADNNNAIGLFLVFSLVYIFCCFFYDKDDEQQNGLMNLFYFACICQAMGGVKSTVVRVGYYFMLSLIILIPDILESSTDRERQHIFGLKNDKSKLALSIIIISSFVIFGLYSLRNGTWSGSYPYHFYWNIQ